MTPILAQGDQPSVTVADFFSWYTQSDPNWAAGGLYAALGLVGALVVGFWLVGGAVPGTAGKAKIDLDEARLDRLAQRLEDIANTTPVDPAAVEALNRTVNELRDDTRRERWRQYLVATLLYSVLGAFFASLLAKDLLQALAIGAGWTSIVGSLGLRSDFAKRKEVKDDALTTVTNQLEQQVNQPAQPVPSPGVKDALTKAQTAQLL